MGHQKEKFWKKATTSRLITDQSGEAGDLS